MSEPQTIKLSKALSAFNYATTARVTWKRNDGVEMWAVLARFAPSSQTIRAKVATRQRAARRKIGKDETFLTGDFDSEVALFCDISLKEWHVLDDDDEPVPIDYAPAVFKMGGDGDHSSEGRELFFKLLAFAMDDTNFSITEADMEADLKN